MGRGAMRCIPLRPTEVGVGPINPNPIVAAAGLRSRSKIRFINPITRLEAIAMFSKHTITAFAALKNEKGKGKENNKVENSAEWQARDRSP